MSNKFLFLVVFETFLLVTSCSKDEDPVITYYSGLATSYNTDIKPVISANYLTCHNGMQCESGIYFSAWRGVKGMADTGRLLGVKSDEIYNFRVGKGLLLIDNHY